MVSKNQTMPIVLRAASSEDLEQLLELEKQSFDYDRLSRRSFRHWLKSPTCVFIVAAQQQATSMLIQDQSSTDEVLGYGLVLMRKGTRLCRLYSIAVSKKAKGTGLGKRLLSELEKASVERGKLFMRLEVACDNEAAINLYTAFGYRSFGVYRNYYHNSVDALRMQKPIHQRLAQQRWASYPWYRQTTEFTCGPASLMMAMNNLNPEIKMNQSLELDLWRQATTIFMTSGHGGCHPIGLGIAAMERGFEAQVYVNKKDTLFLDGVRSEHKKNIMHAVEKRFKQRAKEIGLPVHYQAPSVQLIQAALSAGSGVLSLISTYQLDGKKSPHWVTITHVDENCLYFHDPDPDDTASEVDNQQIADCQHIPLGKEDFNSLSVFGKSKLRTAVIISRADK
ncbi:GNAT family N-acetyltransferase/peptidase C39 family protein [Aliiglaciecola lipolytica]|uniref:Acetyltransferase, GNAT family n=1 Tax=Aliiglaciecola lipolytica E3 TaxID=1127673 RepID=K6YEL6_9ALTE|nr:GNAT family N-acetyltransferase/peptidase C39 family protein [Aliiglaciecola lipolytica]GAC16612.1 acetyltransferase, GNAT family [Aliiglaciecola lipolytica E3]